MTGALLFVRLIVDCNIKKKQVTNTNSKITIGFKHTKSFVSLYERDIVVFFYYPFYKLSNITLFLLSNHISGLVVNRHVDRRS